jgi:hypothetical protein
MVYFFSLFDKALPKQCEYWQVAQTMNGFTMPNMTTMNTSKASK